MLVEFIVIVAVFAVLHLLNFGRGKWIRQPIKGPRPIPIFGNLLQLRGNVRLKLSEWAKKYGSMFTVHFGSTPVLVLSDLKQIRELFGMMISTPKLQSEILSVCAQGRYGIGNADGEAWVEQKNFCIQNLRLFGFDRGVDLEPNTLKQVHRVCALIESSLDNSGKIKLQGPLMLTSTKVIFSMLKHEMDESTFLETFHIVDDWNACLMKAASTGVLFLPWLKYVAPGLSGYTSFKTAHEKLRKQVISIFETGLETRIRGNSPKDLIDAYIDKIENCKDPQSSFYKETGWQHAYGSLIGLLLGSAGAIGIFVNWVLFYLSVYPEVQRKVQQEIDEVTQGKRQPNMHDKSTMRYLEAAMLEILRTTTISSISSIHELAEDLYFHGYHLQKGQYFTAFLGHIHNDKAIWGDPENFRPERYLEEGGKRLKDFVVTFKPGRRSCPGQQTATKVGFLYCAVLLQKYSFQLDPSVSGAQCYLEPINQHIVWPKDLPLVVKAREL